MFKILFLILALPLGANAASVLIAWDALPPGQPCTVIGYNLFRAISPGAYGLPLNGAALIQDTTFLDTTVQTGQIYYYVVRADCATNESANSNELKVDLTQPVIPAPMSMNSFCIAGVRAELEWSPVATATAYTVVWTDMTDATSKGSLTVTMTATAIPTVSGHSYHWTVGAVGGATNAMDFTCYKIAVPTNLRQTP